MSDVVLMSDPRVRSLPVRECGEDLVDVRDDDDGWPLSDLKVDDSGAFAHLRRGLVERLREARAQLPEGYRMLLVEGYRPDHLQRLYFDRYRQRLVDDDPGLHPEEAFRLASRHVSPPDTAPHTSGAAIDLTLADTSGAELDLGTPVNATPEDSDGACYFAADNITAEAREHRRVLARVLSGAGLVNYPTEWWHWSYGDRYWAHATDRPAAIYGPVALTSAG